MKKELVDIGVVFDKPGPVSKCCYLKFVNCPRANQNTFALSYPTQTVGVQSEVSLGHDEDARRFINIDETQHKFSNESEKGGTRALRYAASFITRSGDRTVKNGRHTTGVYATNAFGEALPPLYILDSKAKYPKNFQIDPRVCEGLPQVYGKYGN